MKRFLVITLAAVAALLLVVVGVAFYLIHDQDWIKGEVQELVTGLTGRQLTISGPLEIAVSTHPVIEAEQISLANAPWAQPAEMIRLEKLRVSFDLASVFSDQILIHFIEAENLAVALSENEEGAVNWDFSTGEETAAEPGPPPEDLPVRLDRLTLTGFSLSHEAPGRAQPLVLSLTELSTKLLENMQVDVRALGSLSELPLELGGRVGPLSNLLTGGEINGKLDLTLGDIQLNYEGHVADARTFDGINVVVNFSGPEFEWITRQARLPDFSTGKFDFDLTVDSDEDRTRLDLVGNLGSLDVNASGEADSLFSATDGKLNFEVTGPDLQALGEALGEPNLLAEPYQLKADLSVEDAVTQIHNLSFNIGENQGQVSGTIGKWPKLSDSEFDFWVKGPDISAWGPLLRIENLSSREYEFSGRFNDKDANSLLTTIRLDAGDTFIEAAGILGRPPGLEETSLDIRAMTPDLAKITILQGLEDFPRVPVTVEGNLGISNKSLRLNGVSIDLGGDSLVATGTISMDDYLHNSTVEASATIQSLAKLGALFDVENLPDFPLKLKADAGLSDGAFEFDVHDSSLGELGFKLKGKSPSLEQIRETPVQFEFFIPAISDIPYDVEALKLPAIPGRVSGRFEHKEKLFVLSGVEGSLGETVFNIDTNLSENPGLIGSTVEFSVVGPDIRKLVQHDVLQTLPGDFKLSGRIVNGSEADLVEGLELQLGQVKAKVDGTVNDLMNLSSMELVVSASGPDLSVFKGLLDRDIPEIPFAVDGSVKGRDRRFEVKPFRVTWGPSDLKGDFTLGIGERIDFDGTFQSELISLKWLTSAKDEEEATEEDTAESGKKDRVFPDTPIPKSHFGNVDLDLNLKAGHIILVASDLTGVDLVVKLKEGLIDADASVAGGPLGESITGEFTFDTRGEEAILDIDLNGEGFHFGLMTPEGMSLEKTPPTNAVIIAQGQGTTWHELASSLNGRIRLHQGAGLVTNAGMNLIFSDLLSELFSMLNPYANKNPFTELECGLVAAEITDGQVVVEPLIYQTKELVIVSGGNINLVSEDMALDFHTQVRTGIGLSAGMVVNPFIRLGGKLASPSIELDPAAVAVKGTVAVATVGLSVLGRSLYDRFLSEKNPCQKALDKLLEADAARQQ